MVPIQIKTRKLSIENNHAVPLVRYHTLTRMPHAAVKYSIIARMTVAKNGHYRHRQRRDQRTLEEGLADWSLMDLDFQRRVEVGGLIWARAKGAKD